MEGEHVAWVGVEWTAQPVNDAAVQALAEQARAARLRWLFPFTTYLKPDGSWSPSYQHAGDFVAAYRRADPNTRLLAWVGLPTPSADFADQQMRGSLIAGIVEIVTDAGFDGVHLFIVSRGREVAATSGWRYTANGMDATLTPPAACFRSDTSDLAEQLVRFGRQFHHLLRFLYGCPRARRSGPAGQSGRRGKPLVCRGGGIPAVGGARRWVWNHALAR